ncbi:hypothetical protein D3C76_1325870 [compost metagenome]
MKNTEWGAIAYLSSSQYGKTGEIWINPNSGYLTGHAGTSVNASSTNTTYPYDNIIYGINASSTGNIYGIYDMSGGAYEYTASYVNNGHSYLTTYGASLVSAASQYKDIYISNGDTRVGNYEANSAKTGDAVYETSTSYSGSTSWYNDYSYMPYSGNPFFIRGNANGGAIDSGMFYFSGATGDAYGGQGFRPVLAVSSKF